MLYANNVIHKNSHIVGRDAFSVHSTIFTQTVVGTYTLATYTVQCRTCCRCRLQTWGSSWLCVKFSLVRLAIQKLLMRVNRLRIRRAANWLDTFHMPQTFHFIITWYAESIGLPSWWTLIEKQNTVHILKSASETRWKNRLPSASSLWRSFEDQLIGRLLSSSNNLLRTW